jgi:uncharacterized DUF497 family protein
MPLFEYDPAKSQANKLKHGIDFEQAQELWNDENAIEGEAKTKGEKRFYRTGSIGERQWTAIFTYREARIRIVSVHHARDREKLAYFDRGI